MKKILILGSNGMAGHCIYNYLKSLNKYDIYATRQKDSDESQHIYACNVKSQLYFLEPLIKRIQPDIIINCIGILVKASEDNSETAIFINAYFPHWLEKITKNTQTKIIHLSTDCVFDGKKGNYLDTDIPDGIGFYARSKALGEIINKKDLTLRMSIIGKELKIDGTGLFEWCLRQEGVISGYSKAYFNGISTLELVKAIDKLIESNIIGLYQLAPNYKINKYHLLQLLQKIWNKQNITIHPDSSLDQDKTLINSEPPIPNYIMPSSYEIMLKEYKEYLDANESN
jgi:dTDP-4-dehydrorhamnose reductase